ncbi:hypothetical protein F4824DRAFT_221264 [Ustulina deusta]|nr:hypothetical protein F4824DRAFT_221264 [Ustulina deusta]
MIRPPFNSAIGRTRADLSRVTDGIAASLRAFSTAQQLAAPPPDINGGSNDITPRPTGRQRAAAAFSDLMDLSSGKSLRPAGGSATVFRALDLRSDSTSIAVSKASLLGRSPVNVIRGGFRGRGGFNRGGAGMRGGRPGGPGPAGAMGAGRGRRREGGGGRGRRRRDGTEDEDDAAPTAEGDSPEVLALREEREIGSAQPFDPSISMRDLAGWGPVVAVAGSRAAKDDTVIRQAGILGGGQPFHPLNSFSSADMWQRYSEGSGVFFPSEDMKNYAAGLMGVEAFPPVPTETKDAVLQSALLGTYDGPQYADLDDTLGAVRNYVRRDASWHSDAGRRIEEKVRSLLPGGKTEPANTSGGARASA